MSRRTPMWLRMLRAALLDADTYEEVEADRSAIAQAFFVVCLASAAAALGFWLRAGPEPEPPPGALPLALQVAVIALEPIVMWLGGSAFAYMVGSSFFRTPETETDYLEVLRTTGFAFTPALLSALAFVPPVTVGLVVLGVSRVWTLLACIVAVRQALDFDTLRAVGSFGLATLLLWLLLWGASVAPLPH